MVPDTNLIKCLHKPCLGSSTLSAMLVYQAPIMTQLHQITLFFLFLSLYPPLSLAITLPLTFELNPSPLVAPPYSSSEPIPHKSTPTQPLTPPSIIPIDDSTNTTNENSYECFKTSPFAPARPLYNDCLAAIRLLPISTELGLFQYVELPPLANPYSHRRTNSHSTGDSGDAYQLPRFETSGTCRLILGLDHTAVHGEVGSWAGVGLDAGQLGVGCVQYGSLKDFYGGKTTTGANGLITIVLLYSGTAGVGEKETEVASS